MNNKHFGLLDKNTAFKMEALKKYGLDAAVTDFTIGTGITFESDIIWSYTTSDKSDNKLEDRAGAWFTKTSENGEVFCVDEALSGSGTSVAPNNSRYVGIRPCINYDEIKDEATNKRTSKGLLLVDYGEYPQNATEFQERLEKLYQKDQLKTTGKTYTADTIKRGSTNKPVYRKIPEFKYNGQKFVRLNPYEYEDLITLGTKFSNYQYVGFDWEENNINYIWIDVKPITWIVDPKTNIAISKKILLAGIQFDKKSTYDGNFENVYMNEFLNTVFAKDIIPSKINKRETLDYLIQKATDKGIDVKKVMNDELIRIRNLSISDLVYVLNSNDVNVNKLMSKAIAEKNREDRGKAYTRKRND